MRFSIRTLFAVCAITAIVFTVGYRQRTSYLKQDARRYYGELTLRKPIERTSFGYFLDGGSIPTTLIDSYGVSLPLTASPPGGLFPGDTTAVYVGTSEQMWATRQIQMNGQPIDASTTGIDEPPIRLQRASPTAMRIADYLEDAIDASLRYTDGYEPQNEWQRWHLEAVDRETELLGKRMIAILRDDRTLSETHGNRTDMPPEPERESAAWVRR